MKKLLRRWLGIEEDQHRSAECVVANFEKTAYVINDLSRRVEALEKAQQGGMVFSGAGHWLSFKCSGCGFVCHTYLPDRELVIGGETIFGCPQCRHQTTLARDGHIVVGFDDRIEALERAQRNRDDYLLRLRSVEIRTEIIARRMRDAVSELERYEGTKTDVR